MVEEYNLLKVIEDTENFLNNGLENLEKKLAMTDFPVYRNKTKLENSIDVIKEYIVQRLEDNVDLKTFEQSAYEALDEELNNLSIGYMQKLSNLELNLLEKNINFEEIKNSPLAMNLSAVDSEGDVYKGLFIQELNQKKKLIENYSNKIKNSLNSTKAVIKMDINEIKKNEANILEAKSYKINNPENLSSNELSTILFRHRNKNNF